MRLNATAIGNGRRRAQAGAAAILLLVIVVLGSLYALLSGVNTATADLQQKRDDATTVALRQAKAALIAYAATRPMRPGALPCPDLDDNGIAGGAGVYGSNSEAIPGGIHGGFTCPDAGRQIGRLPWVTLGLPDLRDASGERLWYAISPNFRNDGSQVVNSDTPGLLTVAGVTPATNVVAIIFAPGQALAGAGQNRSGAGVNDVVQYLEGGNAGFGFNFVAAQRCEQAAPACPLGPFNDKLAIVTHQELFDAVENVVARRFEKEIAARIQDYVSDWGIHPFAAPFDDQTVAPPVGPPTTPDRPQSMYWGRDGQISGLLPVAYDVRWTKDLSNGWVGWDATAFAAGKTGGLGDFVTPLTPAGCSWGVVVDNPPYGVYDDADDWRWTCAFTYDGGAMNVAIVGTLTNVARSLALKFQTNAGFGASVNLAAVTLPPPSTTLQASGHATVQFDLALPDPATLVPPPAGPVPVTITFAAPRFSAVVDPAGPLGWFPSNQWYRLAYYSVADGCRLGGVGGCMATVQVQKPGVPLNARSVLVLAGRNLAGGARPWTLAAYFEGENASSPTFNEPDPSPPSFSTFAHALRSPIFNDKVAVLAP